MVCAILSLFPESRQWNRVNLREYYEVFIEAPLDDLKTRDSKGIYRRFAQGEIRDVAGLDLEFQRPVAHLVIENSGSRAQLLGYSTQIAERVLGRCA